jgi:1-phosphatidylinositol phosphodiesterase
MGMPPGSEMNSTWMETLDGSKGLGQFSIPGTHNSGALYEPVDGTAKCQDLAITLQLTAGIRFLDIRCRHINNAFTIYHGLVFQHLSFNTVVDTCTSFLDAHPTECIFLSLLEEAFPLNNTRTFEQTFDYYATKAPKKWELNDAISTLAQARGKIVLMRRFPATSLPKGIDATRWIENATFPINNGATRLKIQDRYIVPSVDEKWTYIQDLYGEAQSNDQRLYLNFTSGYRPGFLGIPNIRAVSSLINPKLVAYFSAGSRGRSGITVMDFADSRTCALIIATNFQ